MPTIPGHFMKYHLATRLTLTANAKTQEIPQHKRKNQFPQRRTTAHGQALTPCSGEKIAFALTIATALA